MLVNNAGVGALEPLLQSDVDAMEEMIDLNVTALTRLTYAAAPAFVDRGGGTIINIGSVVAIAPEVLNGVYGGTKAFVLALSQSLHKELADKNVRIQAVLPGATATNFWDAAGGSVEQSAGRDGHAGRRIWSMRRSPASIRGSSSPSPRFPKQRTGPLTRARARSSFRTSPSIPSRRDIESPLRLRERGLAKESRQWTPQNSQKSSIGVAALRWQCCRDRSDRPVRYGAFGEGAAGQSDVADHQTGARTHRLGR